MTINHLCPPSVYYGYTIETPAKYDKMINLDLFNILTLEKYKLILNLNLVPDVNLVIIKILLSPISTIGHYNDIPKKYVDNNLLNLIKEIEIFNSIV